jgi:hypothetical protein
MLMQVSFPPYFMNIFVCLFIVLAEKFNHEINKNRYGIICLDQGRLNTNGIQYQVNRWGPNYLGQQMPSPKYYQVQKAFQALREYQELTDKEKERSEELSNLKLKLSTFSIADRAYIMDQIAITDAACKAIKLKLQRLQSNSRKRPVEEEPLNNDRSARRKRKK